MMNIRLGGKNLDDIRPLLEEYGFRCQEGQSPDLIIAHGGDGTLLQAEREYPGIPKFPIRDERTAPRCPEHTTRAQLEAFRRGAAPLSLLPKIAGRHAAHTILGINDVFIHNRDRVNALRYRVRIDGELYANEIVGDGVGLASVHGSTAYYRSITHSIFRVGIGLAFSNSTEEVSHLVLDPRSTVEIEVVRGPGILIADNSPDRITVPEHGVVRFFQSEERASIYGLSDFMCPACRLLRHPNKLPFKGLRQLP